MITQTKLFPNVSIFPAVQLTTSRIDNLKQLIPCSALGGDHTQAKLCIFINYIVCEYCSRQESNENTVLFQQAP